MNVQIIDESDGKVYEALIEDCNGWVWLFKRTGLGIGDNFNYYRTLDI